MTDKTTPETPEIAPETVTAEEGAPEGETSVQRALRLKKAVLDARPKPPRGGRFQRQQNARIAAGKSRPWMSK